MRNKVPDDIVVWAVVSIHDAVTQNMRMIAFSYRNKKAKFRFYMSEEPSEDEKELGEVVAVEFESGLSEKLDALDVEFVVTNEPPGKLDHLDFCLFRRWEHWRF